VYIEVPNILRHSCFWIGLGAGLAAMSLHAAAIPDRPQQITRVVRADPRTGKLVRSVVVTSRTVAPKPVAVTTVAARPVGPLQPEQIPAGTPSPLPIDFNSIIEQIAAEHSLHPMLLHSVIKVESNYNPYAVSPKGAMGLMQLMPETARRFAVPDVFNAVDNIRGGAKYLKFLLDLYNGDYRLTLAAYNAGEKAIEKYGNVPPYPETENYVHLVSREIDTALKAAAVARAAAKPIPPPTAVEVNPDEPAHIKEIVDSAGVVHYVSR
jgi:soluble lytic murein transglycosylase-like protein